MERGQKGENPAANQENPHVHIIPSHRSTYWRYLELHNKV